MGVASVTSPVQKRQALTYESKAANKTGQEEGMATRYMRTDYQYCMHIILLVQPVVNIKNKKDYKDFGRNMLDCLNAQGTN